LCECRTSLEYKVTQDVVQPQLVFAGTDWLNVDHVSVTPAVKPALTIQHKRQTARHSRGKVTTDETQNDRSTTSHVLTAVISTALQTNQCSPVDTHTPPQPYRHTSAVLSTCTVAHPSTSLQTHHCSPVDTHTPPQTYALIILMSGMSNKCLQCFDAVGWAAGKPV